MTLEKVKAWLNLRASSVKRIAHTEHNIATCTMAATLLAGIWIFVAVGVGIGSIYVYWASAVVLLVPIVLAIAIGTSDGYALAFLPYLVIVVLDLYMRIHMYIAGPGRPEYVYRVVLVLFIVIYIAPWVLIAWLRGLKAETRLQVYRFVCALQMLLLLGAVYYFTFQYEVRHLADPVVRVRSVRIWAMPLSEPLIEEDAAYVVDRNRRLYRVDLATARKRLVVQLPRLTRAELGVLADADIYPWMDPYGSPWAGRLTRTDAGALLLRYMHDRSVRFVEVTVNEETGEVKWQAHRLEEGVPFDGWPPPPLPTPAIRRHGQILATVGVVGARPRDGHNISITGETVHTTLASLGRFESAGIHANYGWALVRAHHRWFEQIGRLLIISIEER
ncbi:MAG: hypothetical protein KGZ66_07820 [Selenomonadales bacterium]|nr:hypothetical protein [Selenomonadales bacterium]